MLVQHTGRPHGVMFYYLIKVSMKRKDDTDGSVANKWELCYPIKLLVYFRGSRYCNSLSLQEKYIVESFTGDEERFGDVS